MNDYDPAGDGPRRPAETGGGRNHCLRGTLPFPSRFREGAASALGASRRACRALGDPPLRDRLVSDAAVAVSAMSQAQPHARLLGAWLGRDLDVGPCSPWQRRALGRFSRGIEGYLPAPEDITEAGALAELLHSDDIYSVVTGAALVVRPKQAEGHEGRLEPAGDRDVGVR